jgi:hypothetical protein
VDEATAEQWINGPEAQLKKMIEYGDSICQAFPAQLKIAKDLVEPANVANAQTFTSPYHCPSEGSIAGLFDGKANTFWHANWAGEGYGYAFSTTTGTNYFVVHDADGSLDGNLCVTITRRNVQNDHLTELTVYGTNDAYNAAADKDNVIAGGEELYQWTELGVLDLPYGSSTETITSNAITFEGKYKYYKFVATATTTDQGFFHMAEFKLASATEVKRYETTQYDVRKAEADALAAAVAVWEDKAFAADSLELLEDESFAAAFNAIVAAGEAWGKVFVDPAALREAIAKAPNNDLFVIGNNPGQWKEDVVTPKATVEAAEAYNASGAYTPAESEAHIAAIAKAEADVWAAANKVETGKWYRFSFPTEEAYEKYSWDKTGAKAVEHEVAGVEQSPALFGKTVALGQSFTEYVGFTNNEGENDTVAVYSVEEIT